MTIETLNNIKFIVPQILFGKEMILNFDYDSMERISTLGHLGPKILIIIKKIINTLYKIAYFIIIYVAHIIIIN